MGVAPIGSPSRLSDEEIARSDEDSRSLYPPRMRGAAVLANSDKTCGGLGGVARPFLSDDMPRVDALVESVELLCAEVDF